MSEDADRSLRALPSGESGQSGLTVRAATPDQASDVARIYVDCWRSGYHGILPAAFAERLSYEDQTDIWHKVLRTPGNATLLAVTADGAVVGFLCGGPERSGSTGFFAEIYGLYVLPEQRGQGTGRLLFRRFCAQLASIGLRSLLVRVLEANPVGAFYEALGGTEQEQRLVRVAGRTLNEVAFGWRDILSAGRGR